MNVLQAVVLGAVQGLTEFLPVSSSGHLVLFTKLLNLPPSVSFDVILHVSSLLAVLLYFRKKIFQLLSSFFAVFKKKKSKTFRSDWNFIGFLIIGSIPAAIFGILFDDLIEQAFSSLLYVAVGLLITAALLYLSDFVSLRRKKNKPLSWLKAFLIGIFQAVAILPGISRSGSTVSAGLFGGLPRKDAAEFSFLLSIVAIVGAFVFKLKDIAVLDVPVLSLMLGFIASFVASYLAIAGFIKLISKYSLKYFSLYCVVLSLVIFKFFL